MFPRTLANQRALYGDTHATAAYNLAQARREAREHAAERRREVRKRVKALKLEEASERERCGK